MEKKKSVKDTLAELAIMRKASKKRQEGKNVTSEDIKARMQKRETAKAKEETKAAKKAAKGGGNKYGPTAMKAGGTARNFAGSGDGEGYSPKTKVDGSAYSGKSPSDSTSSYKKAQEKQAKKNKSAPRQRRATGREEMIAQRYMDNERRKKEGGSNVVGS
jgi:hypothetical protein